MKKVLNLLILIAASLTAYSQTTLTTREVATGLTTPWEIIWGPDNWIWTTEKLTGEISRINPETGEKVLLHTITEVNSEVQESGLLGMVLHPNFANTPHLFVAYNYRSGTAFLKIVRFTYSASTNTLTDPIIIIDQIPTGGNHHGCRLLILNDKLFATTGDSGGSGTLAQNDNSLNGKILRLNLDGTIPTDNPIAGNPLWTKGHRNAQGLIYVPLHNKIYISEHGGTDELNIIQGGGKNYAWPLGSGICQNPECNAENVVQPLIPNRANLNPLVAPSGIDFYNHDAIPEWKNCILLGNLSGENFVALKLNATGDSVLNSQTRFANTFGRIRDLCVSPDGRVFISTSNKDLFIGTPRTGDDKIIEIKNASFVPTVSNQKSILAFRLLSSSNTGLTADLTGEITENEIPKKVKLTLPPGTTLTASSLTPTIVVSDKATISPASGVAVNFTLPVNYTVTAEDNSTQTYIVTVVEATITGFDKEESEALTIYPNPFSESFTVEGLLDRDTYEVTIFNHLGQCISSVKEEGNCFQLRDSRPGVYYIVIKVNGAKVLKRIVKI